VRQPIPRSLTDSPTAQAWDKSLPKKVLELAARMTTVAQAHSEWRVAPNPQNKVSRFLLADAEKRSGPRNVRAYELPFFSLFQRLFSVIYIFIKYG
jgi:hypothetical protein